MTNLPNPPSDSGEIDHRLEVLSEAVRAVTSDLNLDRILSKLAEITAQLVNARYAALGIPDVNGGMEAFFTYGMTEKQIGVMDHYPRGLGLLGVLLVRAEPLRLEQMMDDERAAGFCSNHPKMTSFLGVPIISKGKHLGSLYLSDRKDGKPFTLEDEKIVEMLAGHAAAAIENAKLSEQLRKLAVIEERDRISMELHDGIIQSIYGMGIKLELLRHQLGEQTEPANQIRGITQDLNKVIEDLRRYIQDLRVGVGYSVDLREQLEEIAQGFREISKARLVFDAPKGFAHLTSQRFHTLLQIIREALSNIVRHADATEVYIDLHETAQQLSLVISDNGQGFDPNQVTHGNGIRNMRQRVRQLGGKVEIASRPGRGTTITINFPVS